MQLMTQDDLFLPLLGTPAAAGLARTFTAQRLQKWNLADISDDALLIVSELVTNASQAAPGTELKFRLSRDSSGILIRIWDPSPTAPVSRRPETTPPWETEGGWGLPIVQALSTDCGYCPTPPLGKWVWSRLTPSA
jgi:anti-sigma regulatory factor (Ser/Thr protein kinase)